MKEFLLFIQRDNIKRYLFNTSWQVGDKVIRIFVSLIVSVIVNRYLGPENYGIISYVSSYVALFFTMASLGLDEIIVREIVRYPEKRDELLGTSFFLKLMANTLVLLVLIISFLKVKNTSQTNLFITIIAFSIFFQVFSVIDYYFQSIVKSKFAIKASLISLFVSSILRLVLVFIRAPLVYFVLLSLLESIITSAGLIYFYRKYRFSIFNWKFKLDIAKNLLKNSWPLIFASVVVMVYMRIDQIMIKEMMGFSDVGVYSVAVRISELWYFIPMSLGAAFFPAILSAKLQGERIYYERLQLFFNLMVIIAVVISVPVCLFSEEIIQLLYGKAFLNAAYPLKIHIWASLFVFLGVASSKWLIAEGFIRLSLLRTVYGVVINIGLNFLLIPRYGISGAAFSTLIAQFFVSYFSDLFNYRTRPIFYMKSKAYNLYYSVGTLKNIHKNGI